MKYADGTLPNSLHESGAKPHQDKTPPDITQQAKPHADIPLDYVVEEAPL